MFSQASEGTIASRAAVHETLPYRTCNVCAAAPLPDWGSCLLPHAEALPVRPARFKWLDLHQKMHSLVIHKLAYLHTLLHWALWWRVVFACVWRALQNNHM